MKRRTIFNVFLSEEERNKLKEITKENLLDNESEMVRLLIKREHKKIHDQKSKGERNNE